MSPQILAWQKPIRTLVPPWCTTLVAVYWKSLFLNIFSTKTRYHFFIIVLFQRKYECHDLLFGFVSLLNFVPNGFKNVTIATFELFTWDVGKQIKAKEITRILTLIHLLCRDTQLSSERSSWSCPALTDWSPTVMSLQRRAAPSSSKSYPVRTQKSLVAVRTATAVRASYEPFPPAPFLTLPASPALTLLFLIIFLLFHRLDGFRARAITLSIFVCKGLNRIAENEGTRRRQEELWSMLRLY